MKKIANVLIPPEMLRHMISINTPPTLHIRATEDISLEPGKTWSRKLLEEVSATTHDLFTVFAKGAHDVHITNPEEVASHVIEFLNRDFNVFRSKL